MCTKRRAANSMPGTQSIQVLCLGVSACACNAAWGVLSPCDFIAHGELQARHPNTVRASSRGGRGREVHISVCQYASILFFGGEEGAKSGGQAKPALLSVSGDPPLKMLRSAVVAQQKGSNSRGEARPVACSAEGGWDGCPSWLMVPPDQVPWG